METAGYLSTNLHGFRLQNAVILILSQALRKPKRDTHRKSKPESRVVKTNLFLCLIKHHAMNTCGGGAGDIASRITSALDGEVNFVPRQIIP
jgi:hypothetical protein